MNLNLRFSGRLFKKVVIPIIQLKCLLCKISKIKFETVCSSEDDLPEVDTPLGRVRGYWKTSMDGRTHAAFEGIPYAKPPVGDLRFEVRKKFDTYSF